MDTQSEISLAPIGVVRSPYSDWAPEQPIEREASRGTFRIEVAPAFIPALRELESFAYVFVVTHLAATTHRVEMDVEPSWAKGERVGLFASRSERRPNPVGLSTVRLLGVEGSTLHISPIDCFDGTPVLDIKPYFRAFDAKVDANDGWAERLDDSAHVLQHVQGAAHEHDHGHDHDPNHDHDHEPGHVHVDGHVHVPKTPDSER